MPKLDIVKSNLIETFAEHFIAFCSRVQSVFSNDNEEQWSKLSIFLKAL